MGSGIFVLFVLIAYLLGSISTAVITCTIMGLPDPRQNGSHNPGATNVYKIAGKKAAFITLMGDLLKGLIPVVIGRLLGLDALWLALIGLSAFLGHLYPLFYSFNGGKGVAIAFGVSIALDVWVGVAMLVSWLLVFKVFKLSSLSALLTATLTPLYFYSIDGSIIYTVMSIVMSILVFFKHRSNIKKIIEGRED